MLVPVILSGGTGSRLWPASRESYPKPFLKLPDGQSLLEKTYRRAIRLLGLNQITAKVKLLTVTNRDYYFMSCDELVKAGATGNFLLEPRSRNTGPAIALAAHQVASEYGPDAVMLVLAADHLISDESAFVDAVQRGIKLASTPHNFLVTFGIAPTNPDTGFGYIKAGDKIGGGKKVDVFVEKPDLNVAQEYLNDGNYLWNSGIFCFNAVQFLKELELCAPDLSNSVRVCWSMMQNSSVMQEALEVPEKIFQEMPNISVDRAVIEKSNNVAVVQGNFGWNDVGSWLAFRTLFTSDINNNCTKNEAIFIDSRDNFVMSDSRLVAAVGVTNMVIIDTKDALLVANTSNVQDVKKVVDILKRDNHQTYKLHRDVVRPWGMYSVLEEGPGFKIKKIQINAGARLSLQKHKYRSEHWVVVKGISHISKGDENFFLRPNQSTYIPAGTLHRIENPVEEPLIMIEVQCGEYLEEDDIERFEDSYGRL